MLDTVRGEVSSIENWNDLLVAVREEFRGNAKFTESEYAEGLPWQGATWVDAEIGTMGCKSNRTGNYLWVETSIGKHMHGDNCKQLTATEAMMGLDDICTRVESKYREFIPDVCRGRRSLWEAKRIDPYYQREVESVPAVCVALAKTFGNKSKLAQYATSVEYVQSREARARFYGKGHESGNEAYINTLRHEEQVRGKSKASYYLDMVNMKFKVAEARAYMNKRFEDWPEKGIEVPDVDALVREHGPAGAAAAALVLMPSLEATFKANLAEGTFYKYRRLATEYNRRTVNVDLRIPEGAWSE